MADATVTRYVETGLPSVEVVVLTATDGETYTSRKFKIVHAGIASGNADNDAHINVVPSGTDGQVTLNYAGMTDQLVTVVLFGKH